MDADKLKNRIREALGAAGIAGEISAQVGRIIDEEVGQKGEPRAAQPARQPDRSHSPAEEDDDDDEDDKRRRRMATAARPAAVKPARKTAARKKK